MDKLYEKFEIKRLKILIVCFFLLFPGCKRRPPLPLYEVPIPRAAVEKVRTTAYTHTESDHIPYANRNAIGGVLKSGKINSAAADWARWPLGTIFRIRSTGELYIIDDYGFALSGVNTIDLYKKNKKLMNQWGVRRVTIEILHWGNVWESYRRLLYTSSYRHIQRMIDEIHIWFKNRDQKILEPVFFRKNFFIPTHFGVTKHKKQITDHKKSIKIHYLNRAYLMTQHQKNRTIHSLHRKNTPNKKKSILNKHAIHPEKYT